MIFLGRFNNPGVKHRANKGALTENQNRFVDGIIKGKPQYKAYIDANYKVKNMRMASVCANDLINNPKIKAEIDRRRGKVAKMADIEGEVVVKEIASMALSNITDIVTWDSSGKVEVKASEDVEHSVQRAIKKIKSKTKVFHTHTEHDIEIEMHDKMKPLEKLGEYIGVWKQKDINVNFLQQLMVQIQQANGVTDV